jgi:hypothetical protein
VELATGSSARRSGCLTLAAISHVFTIDYVAKMLGEDVEWLHELQIDMEPEDGSLWVHGVGEDGVPAFTAYGIEYLKETIRSRSLFIARSP